MSRACFLLIAPGPRPPFTRVAEHLWGRGCDFDSDGNSSAPDARDWTELTVALRARGVQRVDIDPVGGYPRLTLQVTSDQRKLALKAAKFLAAYTGAALRETPADPGEAAPPTVPPRTPTPRARQVVLRDERKPGDFRHFSARIEPNGDLVFAGQDMGDAVEDWVGAREYEWAWTVVSADVPRLAAALGARGDLLDAIAARFSGERVREIEPFLKQHEIPYSFWSRVGD